MAVPVIQSVAPHETLAASMSFVMTKPSGVVSGNLLVAVFGFAEGDANSPVISPPAGGGWTQRFQVLESSSGQGKVGLAVFTKIAGGSEPANYTFTSTANTSASGGILRITGHDPVNFWNIHGSTFINDSSSGNQNAPSVTTTVYDCLILRINLTTATTTIAIPSGTSPVFNESDATANRACCACGSASKVSAGATGTATFTGWSTANNVDGYIATVGIASEQTISVSDGAAVAEFVSAAVVTPPAGGTGLRAVWTVVLNKKY